MRYIIKVFMLSAMAGILFGCNNPKSDAEVIGVYDADYKEAKEKLTLDKDHSFTHEVILRATGQTDVSKGTWKYYPSDGYIFLSDGFMVVLDGFGSLNPDYAHPKSGHVVLPASRFFGKITIGGSEDITYTKR